MTALPAQPEAATLALPPLREELSIHPGPCATDGSPTWVLEDPMSGRYFRLSWFEFEVLTRWHLGSLQAVSEALARQTPLVFESVDVEAVLRFMSAHNLLQARGEQALARMREQVDRMKQHWASWLLKNYLFFRLPLVRPDRFLRATLPWLGWAWSRWFTVLTLACGTLGVYLAARQWDAFLSTFPYFFSLQGMLAMGLALSLAKVAHELGHAYMATRFGCQVPTMGVAFLVMWPVLYTDTSPAWKLRSRRERQMIGAAGMLAELFIAAYALLLWSLLSDGPLRSAVFLLATSTWLLTLVVNLNPLMRFDGYYLLSDTLAIPNLQERAFAYGRWQLREWLFDFGDQVPEYFEPGPRRIVLLYAYATWLYRFFLFLGIALLVYHYFFKLLGAFLMMVELVWFIARPMSTELGAWLSRRKSIQSSPRGWGVGLLALLLLSAFVIPWRTSINAPALWRSGEHTRIFVKVPARVEAIHVKEGEHVQPGQLLFELSSPDLTFQIDQGARQLESLAWLIQYRGMNPQLLAHSKVAMSEYQAEYAAQQSRLAEQAMLQIRSSQTGQVQGLRPSLRVGDWLAANDLLTLVVNPKVSKVEAYVAESELANLQLGASAMFYATDPSAAPVPLRLYAIDNTGTPELIEPYLASIYDGALAVRESPQGRLTPESSIYRVQLQPLEEPVQPLAVTPGTVRLQAQPSSTALQWGRQVWSVLLRETGF